MNTTIPALLRKESAADKERERLRLEHSKAAEAAREARTETLKTWLRTVVLPILQETSQQFQKEEFAACVNDLSDLLSLELCVGNIINTPVCYRLIFQISAPTGVIYMTSSGPIPQRPPLPRKELDAVENVGAFWVRDMVVDFVTSVFAAKIWR